jgi:ankyrin repeat protein
LLIDSLEKYDADTAWRCLTNGVKGNGIKGSNFPIIIVSKNLHADSKDYANLLDLLLQNKVSLNRTDQEGNTPLHYISRNYVDRSNYDSDKHASKIVAKMIQNGANPDTKNHLGQTPLHIAVENSSSMVAKALLEAGANPNIPWASREQKLSLLGWAKENVTKDHSDEGVYRDTARDFERNKVVQLLERYGAKD